MASFGDCTEKRVGILQSFLAALDCLGKYFSLAGAWKYFDMICRRLNRIGIGRHRLEYICRDWQGKRKRPLKYRHCFLEYCRAGVGRRGCDRIGVDAVGRRGCGRD
jgi:hypothetical protein